MPNLQDLAAQDAAYAREGDDAQVARQARQTLGATGQAPGVLSWLTQMPRRVTGDMIDAAVHTADSMGAATRVAKDVAAGGAEAVANTGDVVDQLAQGVGHNFRTAYEGVVHPEQQTEKRVLELQDPAMAARDRAMDTYQRSPIWEHARNAILDFRDAVGVKDPSIADHLLQSVAQLAIPFAGYSSALGGLYDVALVTELARSAAAGAMTDSTALSPHAMRFADLIALGRHTEGKLGEVLRTLDPTGSAQDAYIHYLTDRKNETEAEGRFKNVLDGFGVNMIATPLLAAAGTVLKQGTTGLRYLIDNGAASTDDIVGVRPQMQRGAVGDLSAKRPPLRQNYDPAQDLYDEQVRRDVDAAHAHLDSQVEKSLHNLKFSNEKGVIAVQSPNGFTHARATGDGNWRVFKSETEKGARGRGEGYARLKRLADEAHSHGVLSESDHQVSAPEARLYARLKADGYNVKQSTFERDPGTGELRSTSELKPVFVVGPGELH